MKDRRGNEEAVKYKDKLHPSKDYLVTAASSLRSAKVIRIQFTDNQTSCTRRLRFIDLVPFVCVRNTHTETKSSTSLTPLSLETPVAA